MKDHYNKDEVPTLRYRTNRLLNLTLSKHTVQIKKRQLIFHLFGKTKIPLEDIKSLDYGFRTDYSQTLPIGYGYKIATSSGIEYPFPALNGKELKKLMIDLQEFNPNITFSSNIKWILNEDIETHKIRFNFDSQNDKFSKREERVRILYASSYAFVIIAIILIISSSFFAPMIVVDVYKINLSTFRALTLFLSCFSLSLAISHLLLALISLYTGHIKTIVFTLISLFGLILFFLASTA